MRTRKDGSDLGAILDRIRYLEECTEREIADYLGTNQQTINKRNRGMLMWKIDALIKLSERLKYRIIIAEGDMEVMHEKLDNFEVRNNELKKVKNFGKFSIIEVYSNSEDGVYGNIENSIEEVIATRKEALERDKDSKILIGYCLYNNETGYCPDNARDWHDTVELAEKEYRKYYEVYEEYDMELIRHEIITYMDENVESMAVSHLECWKDRYWGKSADEIEYDLEALHDVSLELENVQEMLDIELTEYEETYVEARFNKEVVDLVRQGFRHLI